MTTKHINQLDVKIGDIVHFYGARFEITSHKEVAERDPEFIKKGLHVIVAANGKWIDGNIIPFYFGPGKDWNFQGNRNVTLTIEI